jgi:pyrroline-5-carboxylate reductase
MAGVRAALDGKLVISMIAGLSAQDIHSIIFSPGQNADEAKPKGVYLSKVVPNIAARYRQSMTILESSGMDLLPADKALIVELIFESIGWVKWVPPEVLNTASMLIMASMAVISVPYEGLLEPFCSQWLYI